MNRRQYAAAWAALCITCTALAACAADQPQALAGKPGAIYIHEPKAPPGLAGPGGFALAPDGKVTVNGSEADSTR